MEQRLAARNRDHRRATLVDCLEAFLRRELPLQNVSWILDLAASGTGQVAAEQGLEHQDERVLFATGNLLPEHIRRHRPHLRNGNTHGSVNLLSMLSGSCLRLEPKLLTAKDSRSTLRRALRPFASP